MRTKKVAALLSGLLLVMPVTGGCSVPSGGVVEEANVNTAIEDAESEAKSYFRVVQKTSKSEGGSSPYIYDYQFDVRGNITRITATNEHDEYDYKQIIDYTYDDSGWPTSRSEKTLLPKDEWVDGKETYSEPKVSSFSFERDEQGRVTRATGPNAYAYSTDSDDVADATMEFSYYESGKLKSSTWQGEMEDFVLTKERERTRVKTVDEYSEDGIQTKESKTTTNLDGDVVERSESTFDEKGNLESTITTRPQKDGKDLVSKLEYKNEYANGKLTKQVEWIYGDGVTEDETYSGGEPCALTYMPDGSITSTRLLPKRDEQSLETSYVRGESKTYEGPYVTEEIARTSDGRAQEYRLTYYDGSVSKDTYDEYDKSTSYVSDSHATTTEYRYEALEHPSEFIRAVQTLGLSGLDPNFSSAYAVVDK